MMRRPTVTSAAVALGAVALAVVGPAASVSAHTESDLVAVPAGGEATVTLKPTHGCAGSPTVVVRIRAPFADASAVDVEGWTSTATPDGNGNTVLEWTGGVLPADAAGAFPVEFVAPEAPGLLLTFPAIQVCADGAELAWISGDPSDEFPAPRVLVLPAGAEPAATIDDVPLDAPGRDQLVGIVDVDNPQATTTTPAPPTTPAPTAGPATTSLAGTTTTDGATTSPPAATATTSVPPADAPTTPAPTTPTSDSGDGGSTGSVIVIAIVVAAVVAAGTVVVVRRRSAP